MRPSRTRARQVLLQRLLLLAVRRASRVQAGAGCESLQHRHPPPRPDLALLAGDVVTTSAAGQFASEPKVGVPVARQQGDAVQTAEMWRELTARQVALCRDNRQRWAQVMDRSEALQAQGLPACRAVGTALEEAGA